MIDETIAAIATAPGEGGIGIVRISGEDASTILGKIFCGASGAKGCGQSNSSVEAQSQGQPQDAQSQGGRMLRPRLMHYGYIRDNFSGELIDEVMAVYFKAPFSYTAEDVVEIQCHGSMVSLRKILSLVLKNGARMAEPGEFTKRAFLNGRLDLSQAEAVIDLIRAKSDKTFDVALSQLEGNFSKEIREIRAELMDSLVDITVNIDYPDEDIEQLTFEKLIAALGSVRGKIEDLLRTSDTGRIISEGLKVSIIGKPNVGKSSLMNALLNETSAIVTEVPGTTRDTIEEMITIRGIPIRLTDTAGIHETDDVVEKIGIEKSKEAFNNADLVILMIDTSRPLDDEDISIIEHIGGRKVIAVMNKSDLPSEFASAEVAKLLPDAPIIAASVTGGQGIEEIENIIEELVYGGKVKQNESTMITNVRHKRLLEEASQSIADAIEGAEERQPLELIEIDANAAYESLGMIIGEAVEEDIINEVFARFCLGK